MKHSDADIASCTVIIQNISIVSVCLSCLCTRQATGLSCHSLPYRVQRCAVECYYTYLPTYHDTPDHVPPCRFSVHQPVSTPISPLSCIRRHVTHLFRGGDIRLLHAHTEHSATTKRLRGDPYTVVPSITPSMISPSPTFTMVRVIS